MDVSSVAFLPSTMNVAGSCQRNPRIACVWMMSLLLALVFTGLAQQGWNLLASIKHSESAATTSRRPVKLTYQKRHDDGTGKATFRIVQITDIHLGEDEFTDWGPEQDRKTWVALDRIIRAENKNHSANSPSTFDLLVLTGDQLTGNNVNANATVYYQILARKLTTYGIPFAMIFGNHDDAPFEYFVNGTKHTRPAKTSRRQLVQSLSSFALSLTQVGPNNVFGVSNYWLDIWYNETTLGSRILLLDTGGGSLPQQIHQTQLDWFRGTNHPNHHYSNHSIPVIAFGHIPTSDFEFADSCRGERHEGVANVSSDAGLLATLQAAGNVHLLGAGHDHGNDYCCPTATTFNASSAAAAAAAPLHLCFGRHSGYGGYGRWKRGARVYELTLTDNGGFSWNSYVRMESGAIQDIYLPNGN